MEWLYKTVQGDTWDNLAYDIYGSEKLMYLLIAANPRYANIIKFKSGIQLVIPQTPITKTNTMRAPWDD